MNWTIERVLTTCKLPAAAVSNLWCCDVGRQVEVGAVVCRRVAENKFIVSPHSLRGDLVTDAFEMSFEEVNALRPKYGIPLKINTGAKRGTPTTIGWVGNVLLNLPQPQGG